MIDYKLIYRKTDNNSDPEVSAGICADEYSAKCFDSDLADFPENIQARYLKIYVDASTVTNFSQIDVSVNKLKPTIPLINKWGDRWWMWTGGVKESEDVTLLIIKYNFNSGNIPQLCIGNSLSSFLQKN